MDSKHSQPKDYLVKNQRNNHLVDCLVPNPTNLYLAARNQQLQRHLLANSVDYLAINLFLVVYLSHLNNLKAVYLDHSHRNLLEDCFRNPLNNLKAGFLAHKQGQLLCSAHSPKLQEDCLLNSSNLAKFLKWDFKHNSNLSLELHNNKPRI